MLLPGLCSFVWEEVVSWHSPWCQTLHFLPVCHWCPSSCCPGAEAQRMWVWVSPKSIAVPLRRDSRESFSFFGHPNPHWFLQPEVMGTYLPGSGTLGWVVWCGAGNPSFERYPSRFLFTTHGCRTACSTSPCLSALLHVSHISMPPIRLDECGFLNSLVVGLPYSLIFWQF